MLRSPRMWLYVAGGWLVLGGLAHLGFHTWAFVLENRTAAGFWEFAMNAMKQATSPGLPRHSMWSLFRAYGIGLGLLWVFAGVVDLVLAFSDAAPRLVARLSFVQTAFWALAFLPLAFLDPVAVPLAIVAMAVPLHGIAYLTATMEERGTG